MEQTTGILADGRQIIWFDPDGSHRIAAPDERPLDPLAATSQMRLDPLTGEWIAVASQRQGRTFMPPADECPLCPSDPAIGRLSEVPSTEYQVVAFENRFPSFNTHAGEHTAAVDDGLVQVRPGSGRCEVVCFSPMHDSSFGSLEPTHARLVVDAWAQRTTALNALPSVEHVYPFENRGAEIGVTLQHPHGQIYAFPFVPPRALTELTRAQEYADRTGGNLFAEIIEREAASSRVLVDSGEWLAFVPFAARWPVEVHLYPKRRVPDLPGLDDAQRDDFVKVYLDILNRFDRLYPTPTGYIAAWQQAPARVLRDQAWLHLELFSVRRAENKIKYLAGSESGQGAFVNDGQPELVAQRLQALAPVTGS